MRRLAVAALVVAAWAAPAAAGDVIHLADGRTLGAAKAPDPPGPTEFAASTLVVTEENTDTVVYKLGGAGQRLTLPRADVRLVSHDPASYPPELTAGLDVLARGEFEAARGHLATVAKNAALPMWAQALAAYRHAESYLTEGNAVAAERALASFARERTRSRFMFDARRLRARILADLGRDEEARGEYDALAKVAGATPAEAFGARFLAAWMEARLAIAEGDAARIAEAAKPIEEIRAKSPALAPRCEAALAALKGGAGDRLVALVGSSQDPFVLAVGGTLLGDAARARGRASKDRAALEAALERYLRVALLYSDAEGAAYFAAKAQFQAGEMFLELAPDDAEAKARARREWEDLVRRAPRGEWGRKAKAALANL